MQVKNLLKLVDCPIELRSGSRFLFTKVPAERTCYHMNEEVTRIFLKGSRLIICSDAPDYELDVDVGAEDPTEDDLPWY